MNVGYSFMLVVIFFESVGLSIKKNQRVSCECIGELSERGKWKGEGERKGY
jgi:hypothetical protein